MIIFLKKGYIQMTKLEKLLKMHDEAREETNFVLYDKSLMAIGELIYYLWKKGSLNPAEIKEKKKV